MPARSASGSSTRHERRERALARPVCYAVDRLAEYLVADSPFERTENDVMLGAEMSVSPVWFAYVTGYRRVGDITRLRVLVFEYLRVGRLRVVKLFGVVAWRAP